MTDPTGAQPLPSPGDPDGSPSRPLGQDLSSACRLAVDPDGLPTDLLHPGIGGVTKLTHYPVDPRLGPPEDDEALTSRWRLPPSCFDVSLPVSLRQPPRAMAVWMGCGAGAALLGQTASWYLFHASDAVVGSLLFTLVCLAGLIFPAYQRHAKQCWNGQVAVAVATRELVLAFTGLSLGLLLGHLLPTLLCQTLGLPLLPGMEQVSGDSTRSLADRIWASPLTLVSHNLRILAVFLLVGLVFRYLGALFVIIYNTAHWGWMLGLILASDAVVGDRGPIGLLLATVALTPHLLIELAGYVAAATSGIWLSRGLMRYSWRSAAMATVTRAALRLLVLAIGLVVLAALIEGWWAGSIVRWISDRPLMG